MRAIGRFAAVLAGGLLLVSLAAGKAHAAGGPAPPAGVQAEEEATRDDRALRWIVALPASTKDLSVGFKACYLGYAETSVTTDLILGALLNGFDHDDIDAVRFSASQTVGVRFGPGAWRPGRRCQARRQAGRWPSLVAGAGLLGLAETDSLTQAYRLGDAGLFVGWSVGLFHSFVFRDVTVTFLYRPFEQTAWYLDRVWDSTGFRFGNPTLEVELVYALPW